MLKKPLMNKSLEQKMAALQSFKTLELKKLLSAQALFNAGISSVAPQDTRVSYSDLKSLSSVHLTI